MPAFARLAQWILAKDFTMTALTLNTEAPERRAPGKSLSVVGAADDNALALLAAALRKLLVTDGKAEVGEIRNIGTVGKNFRAGGHNVSVEILSPTFRRALA